MTVETVQHDVEGVMAKNVVKALFGGGLTAIIAFVLWAASTGSRLDALEKYSVSREEVVKLNGSMDLLRLEIQQLRTDIGNIRQGP
jgi:hypothetical protein